MSDTSGTASGSVHRDVIVVGVDGSEPGTRALVWALDLALRRGWTVEVVTAWPDAGAPLIHDVAGHFCEARHRAAEAQQHALREAKGWANGSPPLICLVVNAHPVEALLQRACGARLLVVGSQGDKGDRRHPGRPSVAETITLFASVIPLVVVTEKSPAPGEIPEALPMSWAAIQAPGDSRTRTAVGRP